MCTSYRSAYYLRLLSTRTQHSHYRPCLYLTKHLWHCFVCSITGKSFIEMSRTNITTSCTVMHTSALYSDVTHYITQSYTISRRWALHHDVTNRNAHPRTILRCRAQYCNVAHYIALSLTIACCHALYRRKEDFMPFLRTIIFDLGPWYWWCILSLKESISFVSNPFYQKLCRAHFIKHVIASHFSVLSCSISQKMVPMPFSLFVSFGRAIYGSDGTHFP